MDERKRYSIRLWHYLHMQSCGVSFTNYFEQDPDKNKDKQTTVRRQKKKVVVQQLNKSFTVYF